MCVFVWEGVLTAGGSEPDSSVRFGDRLTQRRRLTT